MKLDKDISVLESAQLVVRTMDNEANIRQQMEAYGFTPIRMQTGRDLLAKAQDCQQEKLNHYNAQWNVAQQIKTQLPEVQRQFKEYAKVTRIALRNDPATLNALRISRFARKGWDTVRQADFFYGQLQQNKVTLKAYGISDKDVQQAQAAVQSLLSLRDERTRVKGIAENSTQLKNSALQELKEWLRGFRSIAQVAFKHNPQILEAFGMVVSA